MDNSFRAAIARNFRSNSWSGSSRTGRAMKHVIDPMLTRKALLAAHEQGYGVEEATLARTGKFI